jgi:hypothetical protein
MRNAPVASFVALDGQQRHLLRQPQRLIDPINRFSQAALEHYSKLYAMPGAKLSGFMQFAAFDAAFDRDAVDNKAF